MHHYIPCQDRQLVYSFFCILINLQQTRVLNMGKNIKSYATTQVHFPPGKGGKPYGKKSQILRLKYGTA